MAATATQQVINNGPRNLVLKYTIAGTTGDTTNGVLVDMSSLDSTPTKGRFKLNKAWWSLSGFTCKLAWGGGPDVDLLELTSGSGEFDLSDFGGVVNNATQQSGDVLFTTTDYGASGEGGHIVLEFKKRFGAGINIDDVSPATGSLGLTGELPIRVVA